MAEKNLATLFQNRVYRRDRAPLFRQKVGGKWEQISWKDAGTRVSQLGRGLLTLGLEPGARACILSENRVEWALSDLAILSVGGITVPLYSGSSPSQAEAVLAHSGAEIAFVSDNAQLEKLRALRPKLPNLRKIVFFDQSISPSPDGSILSLEQLRTSGGSQPATAFYDRLEKIGSEDLATIIYTSGTTGEPKGVMLTHSNILADCHAIHAAVAMKEEDVFLSFLPLSHALERTGGLFFMIFVGAEIAYAEGLAQVAQNLAEVRPTVILTVPRVLEKLRLKILEGIASRPRWIQHLFQKAMIPPPRSAASNGHATPPRGLAEFLLFRKIREKLGGRLRIVTSGGAALEPDVLRFFLSLGIPVIQGYGITEASPVVSINTLEENRPGTVGRPLPGVEVMLAEDGEILVRGPIVMKGYYRDPASTAATVDPEGFLHTGDVGTLDPAGYIVITDRKKELIKTSGGKFVAPQLLENRLKSDPLVEQACVVGEGKKYVAALLVPNFSLLEQRAKKAHLEWTSRESLLNHPSVRSWFEALVAAVNSGLAGYETIKRFELLPEEFSIEREEITSTLKLRRAVITRRHQSRIARLFE